MKQLYQQKRIYTTLLIGFSLLLLFAQNKLNKSLIKPGIVISKQDEALNFNNKIIKILSLGQQRLISSFLWVHTLLESDIEHYKNNDLNSWMYLRFKSISELEPYFFSNYYFGGQYLSIIKDDLLGAKDIYEKGLVFYPDNFWLRFYNGFNYYFELNDIDSALSNYSKIEQHPLTKAHAPYLPTLIAKLRAQSGDRKLAFELLYTLYQNTERDTLIWHKQHLTLYRLKAEIDLDCLNREEIGCDRFDFEKRPYIFSDGKYRAQEEKIGLDQLKN